MQFPSEYLRKKCYYILHKLKKFFFNLSTLYKYPIKSPYQYSWVNLSVKQMNERKPFGDKRFSLLFIQQKCANLGFLSWYFVVVFNLFLTVHLLGWIWMGLNFRLLVPQLHLSPISCVSLCSMKMHFYTAGYCPWHGQKLHLTYLKLLKIVLSSF